MGNDQSGSKKKKSIQLGSEDQQVRHSSPNVGNFDGSTRQDIARAPVEHKNRLVLEPQRQIEYPTHEDSLACSGTSLDDPADMLWKNEGEETIVRNALDSSFTPFESSARHTESPQLQLAHTPEPTADSVVNMTAETSQDSAELSLLAISSFSDSSSTTYESTFSQMNTPRDQAMDVLELIEDQAKSATTEPAEDLVETKEICVTEQPEHDRDSRQAAGSSDIATTAPAQDSSDVDRIDPTDTPEGNHVGGQIIDLSGTYSDNNAVDKTPPALEDDYSDVATVDSAGSDVGTVAADNAPPSPEVSSAPAEPNGNQNSFDPRSQVQAQAFEEGNSGDVAEANSNQNAFNLRSQAQAAAFDQDDEIHLPLNPARLHPEYRCLLIMALEGVIPPQPWMFEAGYFELHYPGEAHAVEPERPQMTSHSYGHPQPAPRSFHQPAYDPRMECYDEGPQGESPRQRLREKYLSGSVNPRRSSSSKFRDPDYPKELTKAWCDVCYVSFADQGALQSHYETFSHKLSEAKPKGKAAVKNCLSEFSSHKIATVSGGKYFCGVCNKSFGNLDDIIKHVDRKTEHERKLNKISSSKSKSRSVSGVPVSDGASALDMEKSVKKEKKGKKGTLSASQRDQSSDEEREAEAVGEVSQLSKFSVLAGTVKTDVQDQAAAGKKKAKKKKKTKPNPEKPEETTPNPEEWVQVKARRDESKPVVKQNPKPQPAKASHVQSRPLRSDKQYKICQACNRDYKRSDEDLHNGSFKHKLNLAYSKGPTAVKQCLEENPQVAVEFTDERKFVCPLCDAVFVTPAEFLEHINIRDAFHKERLKEYRRKSNSRRTKSTMNLSTLGKESKSTFLQFKPLIAASKTRDVQASVPDLTQSNFSWQDRAITKQQQTSVHIQTGTRSTMQLRTRSQSNLLTIQPFVNPLLVKDQPPGPLNSQGRVPKATTAEDLASLKDILGDSAMSTRLNTEPSRPQLATDVWYCHQCDKSFNREEGYKVHLQSKTHLKLEKQDSKLPWCYRPYNLRCKLEDMQLCLRHLVKQCPYSNATGVDNLCDQAHSEEELYEWRERYLHRWLVGSLETDKNNHVKKYLERVENELITTTCRSNVVSYDTNLFPGLTVDVSPDRIQLMSDSRNIQKIQWRVNVTCQDPSKKLFKAFLLDKKNRHFFSMSKESAGKEEQMLEQPFPVTFYVTCKVVAPRWGLTQTLVLDVGSRPMVGVILQVTSADGKEEMDTDMWGRDIKLIPFQDEQAIAGPETHSKERYLHPLLKTSHLSIVDRRVMNNPVTSATYLAKMHLLLQLEEQACEDMVNRYGQFESMDLELLGYVQLPSGEIFGAPAGTLFAKVLLQEDLYSDTSRGQLLVQTVQSVIVHLNTDDKIAYEARMVTAENFSFAARQRDAFYIQLSQTMLREKGLERSHIVKAKLKLLIDREAFLRKHEALDKLSNEQIRSFLFPQVSAHCPPSLKLGEKLQEQKHPPNEEQEKVFDYLMEKQKPGDQTMRNNPPLVVYGPFGTGKTEILARAAIRIVKKNLKKKSFKPVLICTKNNSACDHFITSYFEDWEEEGVPSLISRVYYTQRHISAIPEGVLPYCFKDPVTQQLRLPTLEEIKGSRVVLTTLSTSLELANLGATGCFSHILIDEACQAMEAEAVTPISLADTHTRVVLAGDHNQTRPAVYSDVARDQRLNDSLMKRLLDAYYKQHADVVPPPSSVLMRRNYRSCRPVVECLSEAFYGGPSQLIAENNAEPPPDALQVHFTPGVAQEQDTSFLNELEGKVVIKIIDNLVRASELKPEGTLDVRDIAVISQYSAQIKLIKQLLNAAMWAYRKSQQPQLAEALKKNVRFQPLISLQGQEFETVILSLVETQGARAAGQDASSFLDDPRHLNTALSRAKSRVIVVGERATIEDPSRGCSKHMSVFLQHCFKRACVFGWPYQLP